MTSSTKCIKGVTSSKTFLDQTRNQDETKFELLIASNHARIEGHGSTRKVSCPYCNQWFNRTIITHLKVAHPKEWGQWRLDMLALFNKGFSPGQIMRKCNTLFTWRLIEKEIIQVSEEYGIPIEPSLGRPIRRWNPDPRKDEDKLEKTTVWSFPNRGDWAVHKGDYKGNWPPQLVHNLIKQFAKKGDLILDPFVGGGTTLIECWRIGYLSIGVDVSPHALTFSSKRLNDMMHFNRRISNSWSNLKPYLIKGDARNLGFLRDNEVGFICGQPPYLDSQCYSVRQPGDLSRISNVDTFVREMSLVAKELFRVLKPGRNCAILVGDVRRNGELSLLTHRIWQEFERIGFKTDESIVKIQHQDKSTRFYIRKPGRPRYRIAHEQLYIFKKPRGQESTFIEAP